ncbi:MAG TPA: cytidylate kinase-like family protein [Syntrophorhabdales bacterium]|nr:cytidylate kinase-like family protein [Syntrophorhabdales bacterium]
MWHNIGVGKCISFIELWPKGKESFISATTRPAITISRMTGAGGHTVASILADYLQMHVPAHDPWTVFDQNLVEKVLEDHHIHKRIADFMQEGHKSMLMDSVEEWMGLHPSTWTLIQQTNATILQLAKMGNVILVGRGGVVITSKLKNVFHVRLVGSLEKRIEYGQKLYGLDRKASLDFIKKRDEGRKRYLKDNFGVDVDDPLLYHVLINTDLVQYDEAAGLIGDEVIRRFKLDSPVRAEKAKTA